MMILNCSIIGSFLTLVGVVVIALAITGVIQPTPQIGFGLAMLFGFSIGWSIRNLIAAADRGKDR